MVLRTYQRDCLNAIQHYYRTGVRKQLAVLATGLGKAVMAAQVPAYVNLPIDKRMLFLVHRDELAAQAIEKMAACNPGRSIGLEKAKDRANDADIVIASIQTLGRGVRDEDGELAYGPRIKQFNPDHFGIIQADEAHHATAPQWQHVLRYFNVLKGESEGNDKLLIGWTATPDRADNIGLEAIFDKIVYVYGIRDGVKEKWLANIVAYRIETDCDISGVHTTAGDLDAGELTETINTPERNELIAREYGRLTPGKSVLAFTTSIAHSEDLAKVMQGHGWQVHSLSGKTPEDERRGLIRQFKAGEIDGLASCGVLTEGTDLPNAEVGIMARPTKSGLLYRQSIGRILRPYPAPEELTRLAHTGSAPQYVKQNATIIDVCDVSGRHHLVTTPTLFALRAEFNAKGKDVLEQAEDLEKLEADNPGLDLWAEPDMDAVREKIKRIRTSATIIDLLKQPETPPEIQRVSKFGWLREALGNYRLGLLDHTMLSVRENALGEYDIYRHVNGIRTKLGFGHTLKDALAIAELHVPNEDRRVLAVDARWRAMEPTEKQTGLLYQRDRRLWSQFRTAQAFHQFALSRYHGGDPAMTRGSISGQIERAGLLRKAQ